MSDRSESDHSPNTRHRRRSWSDVVSGNSYATTERQWVPGQQHIFVEDEVSTHPHRSDLSAMQPTRPEASPSTRKQSTQVRRL